MRYVISAGLLVLLILLSLSLGSAEFTWSSLWLTGGDAETALNQQIFWQLRLPRVALALVAGAALAISGGLLQTISRNQLADPYLFGLVSGAGVGIAALQLFAPTAQASVPLAAFAGCVLAVVLVIGCYRLGRQQDVLQLLLSGLAVSFLLSALLSYLLYLQSNLAASRIIFWLMGSLSGAQWSAVWQLLGVLCISMGFIWVCRSRLQALSCSEAFARSVGVHTGALQLLVLLVVCSLTAVSVSYCGGIALIGLVVPELSRRLFGAALGPMLAGCILLGGGLLLGADTAARALMPAQELPLGVLCAAIGSVFFISLLRRTRAW